MGKSLLALILYVLHVSAGMLLLIFSSWFIAACAIAGVHFNYMLPAVIIRALALTRVASGYGQMWVGHQQLLLRLQHIRLTLFSKLQDALIKDRAYSTEALAHHSEAVASIWVSWVNQNAGALISLLIGAVCLFLWLPDWTWTFALLSICYVALFGLICWRGLRISQNIFTAHQAFRANTNDYLNSASIWHLYAEHKAPDAASVWTHQRKLQQLTDNALLILQALSYGILLFLLHSWQSIRITGESADKSAVEHAVTAQIPLTQVSLTQAPIEQTLIEQTLIEQASLASSAFNGEPLVMIGVMLLLSARDWLSPGILSQHALGGYLVAKKALDTLPYQPLHRLSLNPPAQTESLTLTDFSGDITGVPRISLSIEGPQIVLLKGSSGVGKSTLLQACTGLLPSQGERYRNGDKLPEGLLRSWLYVEQLPRPLSGNIRHNLGIVSNKISDQTMLSVLKQVGLTHLTDLNQWIGTTGRQLSGGELKRFALARALLADSEVLLLDEPFEGLAHAQQRHIAALLNRIARNKIVLIASHIEPDNLLVRQSYSLD